MTYYTSLPPSARCIVAGLLFLAALTLMTLCLYKYIMSGIIKQCIRDITILTGTILLLSCLTAAAEKLDVYRPVPIPWVVPVMLSIALIIYSVINIYRQYVIVHCSPSPASIKEAFDNLDSAICFSDKAGRIILINHAMGELIYGITGIYPQTISELKNALMGLVCTENCLYHFPDGEIWKYQSIPLSDNTTDKYTQTTFVKVTKLYKANEMLADENAKLQETNEKINQMMIRLADRIREEETLNLKIRVHNDIGSSLIAIAEIMDGNNIIDADKQLNNLRNAIGYFQTTKPIHHKTFDDLRRRAENIGISLIRKGSIPSDAYVEKLIILAADECITNCKKHTSGDSVYVDISNENNHYSITITNNGTRIKDDESEGGGLSNLRKKIEEANGAMNITWQPAFILNIELPCDI